MKNDRSTSGYLTDKYEGLSTAFADVEQQPSTGYCDLFRAKRFGRWYLLKCLRPELQGDEAYRQMLRKELEILMRLQHPGVMQAVGMETVVLPGRGDTVCMVAEWIDGVTLADYLLTKPSARGHRTGRGRGIRASAAGGTPRPEAPQRDGDQQRRLREVD